MYRFAFPFARLRAARIAVAAAAALVIVFLCHPDARATFSIVAVDTATGAVGSAGASCITGAQIIERVVEGVGAMNTQAYWNSVNQARGDSMMRAGDPPDSIISFLVHNDAQNDGLDQSDRQYGAVTLAGPGASASHTGANNSYWAGARSGFGYSAQGNILLDSTVVYGMEAAFLATSGPLEDRLMAALQAAKVPGADSRCFMYGKSTISAFIKVVHPGDGPTPFLDLVVNNTPNDVDPIDVLQDQFDAWRAQQIADPDLSTITASPDALPIERPGHANIIVAPLNSTGGALTAGAEVTLAHTGTGTLGPAVDQGDGSFLAELGFATETGTDTITATVIAGGQTVPLTTPTTVVNFLCGDVNEDGLHTSADIIWLVNYVFKGGPPPKPVPLAGDTNRNFSVTSADIIYLVGYVFKSGAPPCTP